MRSVLKKLIIFSHLVFLTACIEQFKSAGAIVGDTASSNVVRTNPIKTTAGIVYFSFDNGLTWEDKSAGLSVNANIGLGGVAGSANRLALVAKDSGLYFFDFEKNSWLKTPFSKQLMESNPGAITFYKGGVYIGTQHAGVFYSPDEGKNWIRKISGLTSLTVRKLTVIDGKLYAATNSGLYSFNEVRESWEHEYGDKTMQVNGVTGMDDVLYIASNQGAFASPKDRKSWRKVFANGALHNIGTDGSALYAMVYNELFSSTDNGKSWQNIQTGLPAQLYTFNAIRNGETVFAGQWDGVYRKDSPGEIWRRSGTGLPDGLAVTNLLVHEGIIVISGNERKLRTGMTTDK